MESGGIIRFGSALLAPEQALTLFFGGAGLRRPNAERVPLAQASGRILAERICSDAAYPAQARSAMDGFAVRASDVPGTLRITGEIRMGHPAQVPLESGSAMRVPTGGVLPPGADAVVPVEDARADGDRVAVETAVARGDCVTPAGSDMRAGEAVLEPGRRLGAAEIGVLATLGCVQVPVFCRPLLGVLSSGDEVVPVDAPLRPGQVRDSNRWALAAALETMGARVQHLPHAGDEPGLLERGMRQALAACDGLVLSGGSSVGARDFTPAAVAALGSPGVLVHGLRVKPGKPTLFASIAGKPVLGLPGNPASALMILEAVAAPIVQALCGAVPEPSAGIEARLAAPVRKRLGWTWFVPVQLDLGKEPPAAHPLELRSTSTSLLARGCGFVRLGETVEQLDAGTAVRVVRFSGS